MKKILLSFDGIVYSSSNDEEGLPDNTQIEELTKQHF